MTTYFLHLVAANERIEDPEGAEFRNLVEAREVAITSAREILAERIKHGQPLGQHSIEIADAQGTVMDVVRLRDVLLMND